MYVSIIYTQEFRAGHSRVLVSTDLLARGIDVHHVSIVCNVDLPHEKENYIHRYPCQKFYTVNYSDTQN